MEKVEEAWKEQNRRRTEMEKVTNSPLMAIYRLFPVTADTHSLNPLSHFLLFTYPSPSFCGKFVTFCIMVLYTGVEWCEAPVEVGWQDEQPKV